MRLKIYNKINPLICIFALLLSANACTVVTIDKPIGDEEVQLDPVAWNGKWSMLDEDGNYIEITVTDAEKGILKAAVHEDSKPDESSEVHLRRTGDWIFFNIMPEGEKDYIWGRCVKRNDLIIFWVPSYEKFMELVEKGRLSADLSKSTIRIKELTKEQLDLITSEISGSLFEWEEPGILLKNADGS